VEAAVSNPSDVRERVELVDTEVILRTGFESRPRQRLSNFTQFPTELDGVDCDRYIQDRDQWRLL
jgi:hypothetical protein